jgi:hypothetical protein
MRLLTLAAAAAAVTFVTPGTAGADPDTQAPAPPYQILTPAGPTVGGLRTLPPVCAAHAAGVQSDLESEHRGLGRATGRPVANHPTPHENGRQERFGAAIVLR